LRQKGYKVLRIPYDEWDKFRLHPQEKPYYLEALILKVKKPVESFKVEAL
jgi:hypothetical protein